MKLDYLLELINSKLPKKQPAYYTKWLIVSLLGFVLSTVILYAAQVNQQTISMVGSMFGLFAFIAFLGRCLAVLYNDDANLHDLMSTYMPTLTASSRFNSFYSYCKHVKRWTLIACSYSLIVMIAFLIFSIGYLAYQSWA